MLLESDLKKKNTPLQNSLKKLERFQTILKKLNQLNIQSHRDQHRLLNQAIKIVHDCIIQQKQTEDQLAMTLQRLEEKNKKLEESNKLKSHFVANVSHEFKNPLTVIMNAIDLALEESRSILLPDQIENLEVAQKNIKRLNRLVSDMLDLSKIECGKISLQKTKVLLEETFNETFVLFKNEFQNKRIQVHKHFPLHDVFIHADKDKISQVIINLLHNAIKYTPENGDIDVFLQDKKNSVELSIKDSGPGISQNEKEVLFNKFKRIKSEKEEGSGLGLSIVKDIVELHHGKIWVESSAGHGTQFFVCLPK